MAAIQGTWNHQDYCTSYGLFFHFDSRIIKKRDWCGRYKGGQG